MTQNSIRSVILCGGNGKRLWPVSRESMPKQFARLNGDMSLLQETAQRLEDCGCVAPILMAAETHRFTVATQMEETSQFNHTIVLEPEPRNTAAAFLAAAEIAAKDDPDTILLFSPSDHVMKQPMNFCAAMAAASEYARRDQIVTFGIKPERAETGYGYIQLADELGAPGAVQRYLRFVEKPGQAAAEEMIESGEFLWNSGIFMVKARALIEMFKAHQGKMTATVRKSIREGKRDLDFFRIGASYAKAQNISFDHAIMEQVNGWVAPIAPGWSDLGNWRSVWQESHRTVEGVARKGAVKAINCQDSLLVSDDDNMQVVGIGLRNIAAVATRDAVMITDLDSAQSMSVAVEQMRADGISQATDFPRIERPWGHYETLALGPRFQVKAIVVRPGGKLSLQSHMHRAEHWVVVEGSAVVTVEEDRKLLGENESIFIPLGAIHRLENAGRVPLRLIEVQSGTYLGEDDIVRYEDIYERA